MPSTVKLGRFRGPNNKKLIGEKEITTANRALKKGRKFPKIKKGATSFYTREQFKAPPTGGKKNTKQESKDLDLVYDYGEDAQRAKSFGTIRKKTGGHVVDSYDYG